MRAFNASLLLLAVGGCTWEPPLLDSPFGPPPLQNTISGEVLFAGEGDLGPTFMLLYDITDPPPPAGTGSPVTFSSVPLSDWAVDLSVPAAPYGVGLVPDGTYLVNGLMDVDQDFNALDITLSGATCGDWVGSHVTDLVQLQPQPVTVEGGTALNNVSVFLGQQVPTERPAFGFVQDGEGTDEIEVTELSQGIPQTFSIRAAEVDGAVFGLNPLELGPACLPDPADDGTGAWTSCDLASIVPCNVNILTELVDDDGDYAVDPYPDPAFAAQGIPNIWPRVFLEYLPDEPQFFQVDGVFYQERWITQAFPLTLEILGAAQMKLPADVIAPVGTPLFAETLSITVFPTFQYYNAKGTGDDPERGPFDVIDITQPGAPLPPLGRWKATIITRAGQTWETPNALAIDPEDPAGVADPVQASYLTFQ